MKIMLKATSALGLALMLLIGAGLARAGDLRYENPSLYAELRDTTFVPLFEALRNGDVASLKQYLQPKTYEQYRVLLEQNKTYPEFLRKYYAGAKFDLDQVVPAANGYLADVLIYWPNGDTSVIKLEVAGTEDSAAAASAIGRQPSAKRRWGVSLSSWYDKPKPGSNP